MVGITQSADLRSAEDLVDAFDPPCLLSALCRVPVPILVSLNTQIPQVPSHGGGTHPQHHSAVAIRCKDLNLGRDFFCLSSILLFFLQDVWVYASFCSHFHILAAGSTLQICREIPQSSHISKSTSWAVSLQRVFGIPGDCSTSPCKEHPFLLSRISRVLLPFPVIIFFFCLQLPTIAFLQEIQEVFWADLSPHIYLHTYSIPSWFSFLWTGTLNSLKIFTEGVFFNLWIILVALFCTFSSFFPIKKAHTHQPIHQHKFNPCSV